jgi:hypothetical protein
MTLVPDIITSLGEFERVYGDRKQLVFGGPGNAPTHNFMWHAIRAFFEEGGKRLYVSRIFKPNGATDSGRASRILPMTATVASTSTVTIKARFPGDAGNVVVRFTLNVGQSVLGKASDGTTNTVSALLDNDIVWLPDVAADSTKRLTTGTLYIAKYDPTPTEQTWKFYKTGSTIPTNPDIWLNKTPATPTTGTPRLVLPVDSIRVVTVTVTVIRNDGSTLVWSGLSPDPNHRSNGDQADSIFDFFSDSPSSTDQARSLPIVITRDGGTATTLKEGILVLDTLFTFTNGVITTTPDSVGPLDVLLKGGNDGALPTSTEYEGAADPATTFKTGLKTLEDLDDISIVAAPGSTANYTSRTDDANTIISLLIRHAEYMRYRIAVLDSGDNLSISAVRAMRAKFDSKYAALYYPWVRILDPVTRVEINLPPSGFVAGIYARNDITRAVYKAPANEVVNLALSFELMLNKSQQEVLNPEGINCFRFFEGRGYRLWGARTISSDSEWKYVNLRRYFAYLEHSIDKGTQFAVFEPNGPALWANVRRTIEDFLLNEWQQGALLGDKPETSYFVRCDRSTMTQNDLDNGRLVCLIGVAPLRPAEFVIFRIGQWTGDRR